MTDRHSVFSAATPFQHASGTQVASAPEMRIVHPTPNTTPRSLRTIPSSKISEGKRSPDPRIQQKLEDNIVEVKTDAFVLAVLYNGAERRMKEDANLAAKCFDTLRASPTHEGRAPGDCSPQQPTIPPSTASYPTESTPGRLQPVSDVPIYDHGRFFALMSKYHPREKDIYRPYVGLLNYVSRFFRSRIEDVDGAWPPAQRPNIPIASQNAAPPLNRVFRDTHNQPRSFSRNNHGQEGLKPDICLLVESEGNPKEFKGKPKTAAHWKDVLVPIDVKREQVMNMDVLVQVARYALSVMLEQFDRNFAFTVLLTGEACRVFHWDVAGAQVTEPFNFHKNPELFLQVMGRLATMTPSELGYDTHFSNAGRVLSSETDITPYLTIHSSKPRPFFNDGPKLLTPQCPDDPHALVLELQKMQFEAKDVLFNWATRVWRAVAVNDPPDQEQRLWSKGATYIVKQNWADDRRPNEGFFHKVAHKVEAVPPLVMMEEREFTSSFRARFNRSEVLGILPRVKAEYLREIAHKRQALLGPDASYTYDHARTYADGADVSGKGEGMSVDDVDGDAASDEDEGVDGDLSVAGVGDEVDVGDNEDVADQKDGSKVDEADGDANGASGRSLERVLLRFVFGREGRSLSQAKDSIELLQATEQWITGLIELDKLGITHRDISYGNLLLPPSTDGDGTGQASIIDLGLSHLVINNAEETVKLVAAGEPGRSSQDHDVTTPGTSQPPHHVTGTLPFVACDLLFNLWEPTECIHGLHHDVESVFWVLLYVSLKEHGGMLGDHFEGVLRLLTSSDVSSVRSNKYICLEKDGYLKNIGGKFRDLEGFLIGFTEIRKQHKEPETAVMFANKVQALASIQLKMIRAARGEKRKLDDSFETDGSAPAAKKK